MIPKILTKAEKNFAALERHQLQAERHAQAARHRAALNKEKKEKLAATKKRREALKEEKIAATKKSRSNARRTRNAKTPFTRIRWRNEMGNNRTLANIDPYTSPSSSPPPAGIINVQPYNANPLSENPNPYDTSVSFNTTKKANASKSPRMIHIHQTHGNRPPPMTSNKLLEEIRKKLMTYKARSVLSSQSKIEKLLKNAETKGLINK